MRVNIHIRKENEQIWERIANKSEWVNQQLQGNQPEGNPADTPAVSSPSARKGEFEQFLEDYSDPSRPRPPHPIYGYPCCHQENRCKHWEYNDISAEYKNILTKETIDVSF